MKLIKNEGFDDELEHTRYDIYKDVLQFEFQQIRAYLGETKDLIGHRKVEHSKWVQQQIAASPGSKRLIEHVVWDERMKYEFTFPRYLFHSCFILAYSAFESFFHKLCLTAVENIDVKFLPSDIAGEDTPKRYRDYLRKALGIEFPSSITKKWQQLAPYQFIRNWLVHDLTDVKRLDPSRDYGKWIAGNRHLHYTQMNNYGSFYIYDGQLILDFCNLAEDYLIAMTDLLESKENNK